MKKIISVHKLSSRGWYCLKKSLTRYIWWKFSLHAMQQWVFRLSTVRAPRWMLKMFVAWTVSTKFTTVSVGICSCFNVDFQYHIWESLNTNLVNERGSCNEVFKYAWWVKPCQVLSGKEGSSCFSLTMQFVDMPGSNVTHLALIWLYYMSIYECMQAPQSFTWDIVMWFFSSVRLFRAASMSSTWLFW